MMINASYQCEPFVDRSPYSHYLRPHTDTVGAAIGVVTPDGIAWNNSPSYEITTEIPLQLHLRFFKNHPKIDDAQNLTLPLEITVYIGFNPSNPEAVYGIICINNPLIYSDPSGHWFGIDDAIAAIVGAIVGGTNVRDVH